MNTVVLGATRGMGRALARVLVDRGDRVFLLGLPEDGLEESAKDLEIRGQAGPVGSAACNLLDPKGFAPALDQAEQALGRIEAVVVTAAMFAPQERMEQDADFLGRLLQANFTGTVLFCEEARRRLLAHGGGVLCAFSSVAGDRGRKPVVYYGATKAGLSYYLEALDHKYYSSGLRVVCVKPGFVKTGMTSGLKPPPFAGEPEAVAKAVVRAIDKRTPVIYVPRPWWFVMAIIRRLPRFVMRRINF